MKPLKAQLNARNEKELKMKALYVAMVVRNALEDFHCKHLSDEQMKELNPLIRNAISSALYAHAHFETSPVARHFVQYHMDSIPFYWETPRIYGFLLRDYPR
jgi:hypothetical protein